MFVCITGEHKWEASVARYIKMASFPHLDPAILLGTSKTAMLPTPTHPYSPLQNDLYLRFLTSALKSNPNVRQWEPGRVRDRTLHSCRKMRALIEKMLGVEQVEKQASICVLREVSMHLNLCLLFYAQILSERIYNKPVMFGW